MSVASFNLFRGQLMGSNKLVALHALAIAEKAHAEQFRKDGVTPYIEHPMKVASFLYTVGIRDDEILAVALLHDVLEDTDVTVADLHEEGFSVEVIEAVSLVTKKRGYNNNEYYTAILNNPYATIVKLADRAHNLETLYNFTQDKKESYLEETKTYIFPLLNKAQHTYYKYSDALRILEIFIQAIYNNLTIHN